MNDNFLASIYGSVTSFIAMILGAINITSLIEVAIYGFVGAAAGLLGKWTIQYFKKIYLKYF